jgi:hypothetical protein
MLRVRAESLPGGRRQAAAAGSLSDSDHPGPGIMIMILSPSHRGTASVKLSHDA